MPVKTIAKRRQRKEDPVEKSKPAARSLTETLAYRNDMVVYKFIEAYDMSFAEAEELFTEAKRWLWLCARCREIGGPWMPVTREIYMVDEMWHTFVLFTKEYHRFCDEYLGEYVDHSPTTKAERDTRGAAWAANPERAAKEWFATIERMMFFVEAELGEATLTKWFVELPARYPAARINSLRRPLA